MPRPIILGVVGDSAAGKTTITRGLVRALGDDAVNHICTDDYHRFDRKQRAERGITPLHPDCNYVDVMSQDLAHIRAGEPILKPVYRHTDGTFGAPIYIVPAQFAVIEGLLGYHTEELRRTYDVRVFLAPPEELRRKWKVGRDCSRRGYTTDEVLSELDRREPDSEAYIRPQQSYADIVVSFRTNGTVDDELLDAELVLRPTLEHPDLSPFIDEAGGIRLEERGREWHVLIPGKMGRSHALEIEEAIWERMHFASHLRSERLGEFTLGTELHRSESLALVQLLILYHLVTAKASIALGAESMREPDPRDSHVVV
ncbi:MAG TPA: phosphoribulokinase [Gaiellaceae bacterium]